MSRKTAAAEAIPPREAAALPPQAQPAKPKKVKRIDMTLRNRIVGLRYVEAAELVPHELNYRQHPESQQKVMATMLDDLGVANAVLGYKLPDGRYKLIDGHLRLELLSKTDTKIPLLELDVTEDEAKKLLLTLDPLAAMAQSSYEKLRELKASLPTDTFANMEDVDEMLESLLVEAAVLSGGNTEIDSDFFDTDSLVDEEEIAEKPGLYMPCPTCDQKIRRDKLAKLISLKRGAKPPRDAS